MKGFSAGHGLIVLVAGIVVASSLAAVPFLLRPQGAGAMSFWEAHARGLVSVAMVNETVHEGGEDLVLPVGIHVTNLADVPVVVSEEAVLMSPHPSVAPPDPLSTTQDAILTTATIPAGGAVTFSYGELVVQGLLPGPTWWCAEENQFAKADVAFHVGGETLPFALRPLVENPFYNGTDDNTQAALWAYLRTWPAVVVGKEPLWTQITGEPGQTVPVTIDATNLAVWAPDDAFAQNVNVTRGVIEDDVPAGWTVEEGSYSIPPDEIIIREDGTQTLRWFVDLPAAQVDDQGDFRYPVPYVTVNRRYNLVSPGQETGTVELPRARSDMNNTGAVDAWSAPVVLTVLPANDPPIANAGGPYVGREGDEILLDASGSSDPDGDPLLYRWSYTDNGTFDTPWSPDPTARVRYTDDFSGHARVQVTDGHSVASQRSSVRIENVPPTISELRAMVQGDFRLMVAGEKWHDVRLTIRGGGEDLASVALTRWPGSPAAQSASTGMLLLDLLQETSVLLVYTPEDDRVNGQPAGDNPVWLVVSFPNGREVRLLHNFNTQRPSSFTWTLPDLLPSFPEAGVTLTARLHDAGSDDLMARWDFGDGTSGTERYPNGPGGDLPSDPLGGIAPFDVVASTVHVYPGPGTYRIVLRLADGDGGEAMDAITLVLG